MSFYDHSIEKYALMEGQPLSLAEMLSFGRQCAGVPALWNKSAAHVQSELPIRLARRLMDLQFLPYVVVTNPHVLKVYKAVRLGPPARSRARAPAAGAGPPGLTAAAASTATHRARPPPHRAAAVPARVQHHQEAGAGHAGDEPRVHRAAEEDGGRARAHDRRARARPEGARADRRAAAAARRPGPSDAAASIARRDVRAEQECSRKPIVGEQLHLDSFLNTMLRSRIERRVLGEHHIALQNAKRGWVGIMCMELGLRDAIRHAEERVAEVCRQTYSVAPEVVVTGDTDSVIRCVAPRRARPSPSRPFRPSDLRASPPSYIPAHLDYILFEVMKNASRAVVERHSSIVAGRAPDARGASGSRELPPIEIRICAGSEGVTIRVSDQGGGIPAADVERIWHYGYTTVDDAGLGEVDTNVNVGALHTSGIGRFAAGGNTVANPMAGLGFGLPLSRLYTRFLGGDLVLTSVPGYGSDLHVNIPDLQNTEVLEKIII